MVHFIAVRLLHMGLLVRFGCNESKEQGSAVDQRGSALAEEMLNENFRDSATCRLHIAARGKCDFAETSTMASFISLPGASLT